MSANSKLSVRQQVLLGFLWLMPWTVFGVLATDVLPVRWRFGQWPEGIRSLMIFLFVLFNILDFVFSVWYVFGRDNHERETDISA